MQLYLIKHVLADLLKYQMMQRNSSGNYHSGTDISATTGTPVYATYSGTVECTGNSTGPHLHYEVRNAAKHYGNLSNPTLNPYNYLPSR